MGIAKNKTQSTADTELRRKAEEQFDAKEVTTPSSPRTSLESRRLVHELEVHQIELEMQNAELLRARDQMEAALDKYADLYDFAPVGYCTLDREGTVQDANLTIATLLGIERSKMLGKRFGLFVVDEARQLFSDFLEKVFCCQCNESCEVRLTKEADPPLFVRIEARTFNSVQECRVAITDVSGRKRAEEKYHQSRARLAWVLEKTCIGSWLNDLPLKRLTWDAQTRRLFFVDPEDEPTIDLFWSRIHPDDREPTRLAVENALHNRTLYEIDHRAINPVTGEIRWIHSAGQAVYAADDTRIRFDGINYDITEIRTAREELQKAHDEMEKRVRERTEDLHKSNLQLVGEIEDHKKAKESLLVAFTEIKQLKERLRAENLYLQKEVDRQFNFGEIIGKSAVIVRMFSQIEQVAPLNATVLLLGETGTGKGVVARALHSSSARKHRPLITVNCTTLPATLVESELFGRERGAYTGSDTKQIGRFELADGGTIFLDEIGEMPLELQGKLLRVIQDGEFERLGNPHTIKTDVRIIAASNRNLDDEVKNGTFRKDLFYRLNVFPITMPTLRQRKEDIPLLVNHFVDKYNKKIGRKIESVSKETLNEFQKYHWPGNVRELESVIERSVIISQGAVLQVLDRFDAGRMPEESTSHEIKALVELEHDHILQVLQKTGWRIEGKNGAALLLGLNASTLRARMRKYGILRQ
jgi:transcriptional regulator with PAS, ATPase and Fis domain